MALTGHGLDFDLCSCEAQIKDSIYCCFMAAGMMNGAVSRSNQASVSLPHILIAKVASHRSALLPSPFLPTCSSLCFPTHCLLLSRSLTLNNVPLSIQNVWTVSTLLDKTSNRHLKCSQVKGGEKIAWLYAPKPNRNPFNVKKQYLSFPAGLHYSTHPALARDIQQTSLMKEKIPSCINIKSHFIRRKNVQMSSSDRVYVFSLFFKSKHILRYMTLLSRLSMAPGRHPSVQNEASIFCSMRGESFPLCRDDI